MPRILICFGVPWLALSLSNREWFISRNGFAVARHVVLCSCQPKRSETSVIVSASSHQETGVFCEFSALEDRTCLGAEDFFRHVACGSEAGVPSFTLLSRFARLNFMCSCARPATEPQTREAPLQIPSGSVPEVHAISHCEPPNALLSRQVCGSIPLSLR